MTVTETCRTNPASTDPSPSDPDSTDPASSDPDPDRIRFAPSVSLSKAEAFGACQALADADRVLLKSGLISEATALGDLFELLEQRLASQDGEAA